jgi:hypothetical protein
MLEQLSILYDESANIAQNSDFMSSGIPLPKASSSSTSINPEELILPFNLYHEIRNLSNACAAPDASIYSASVAFLAGYIIKKLNDKFSCDECLTPLVNTTLLGPLLRLIALQDRGGLTYPNGNFVALVKQISDITLKILPHLKCEKTCEQLMVLVYPSLIKNQIFECSSRKSEVCRFIIKTIVKPVLDNICLERTDLVKKILALSHKPEQFN